MIHVCQISKQDDNLLFWNEEAEPLQRQISYFETLEKRFHKPAMTMIILHRLKNPPKAFTRNNITIKPIYNSHFNRFFRLFFILLKYHFRKPISVITAQIPYDEAWPMLLFSKFVRIPSIAQIHFDIFDAQAISDNVGSGLVGKIRFAVFSKLIRYFSAVRVVGKRIADQLISQKLVSKNRIFVLPVTVPLVKAVKGFENTKPEINRKKNILFVGRLINQKNLFYWLDLAKAILMEEPETEFTIVGSGILMADLKTYAKKLGIEDSVRFEGEINNSELSTYYLKSDLFLLTSFYEGFGRVILEAGAFGLPVVSTKITGPEDIIINGYNGYLFELDDKHGMVNKIVDLLRNHDERVQLGQNNYHHVQVNYGADYLKQQWVNLWTSFYADYPKPISLFRRRSFAIWKTIFKSKHSLWRTLTYTIVQEINLTGRTLDIGGGDINSYHHLIQHDQAIDSVNISPEVEPTILADLNYPLNIASETYDNVISLNTFEHIRKIELAVEESFRVLKKGGSFHFFVPFLYKLHAIPHDYNRPTAYWWIQKFKECGLNEDSFFVEPILWNSSSSVKSSRGKPLDIFTKLTMLARVLEDLGHYQAHVGLTSKNCLTMNYPLGYYIHGKKYN